MEELSIEKFNPTIAELQKIAEEAHLIVITDTNDKAQLELVKKTRISLGKTRVAISKKGKELRDDALTFQRAVIAKEKELIAIIEPEESRLEQIEEDVKKLKLHEERLALLPSRKEQLEKIGDGIQVEDSDILIMDSTDFQMYANGRVSRKNEADRIALEQRENAAKLEELRLQREKDTREREEIARKQAHEEAEARIKAEKASAELRIQQEKENADRRVKEERERMEREQKAKEEREAREKVEAEAKARANQEALEKKKKYQIWLKKSGWTEETKDEFYLMDHGHCIELYKLIGKYDK